MCQCCLKITQEYPAGEAMFTVFPSEHECLPIFAIITEMEGGTYLFFFFMVSVWI